MIFPFRGISKISLSPVLLESGILSISEASALLMILQRFGMICLMMYVQPLLSSHSERSSESISLHKHNFCFSRFLSVALTPAMSHVIDYRFFCIFCMLS